MQSGLPVEWNILKCIALITDDDSPFRPVEVEVEPVKMETWRGQCASSRWGMPHTFSLAPSHIQSEHKKRARARCLGKPFWTCY